jgi:hypothetical protein
MHSFAFLLIVTDDTQEWGRKYLSELYIPAGSKYDLDDINFLTSKKTSEKTSENIPHECEVRETVRIPNKKGAKAVITLLYRLRQQALTYVTIFRDGQETKHRDFSFIRKLTIVYEDRPYIKVNTQLDILKDKPSCLKGNIEYSSDNKKNEDFDKSFFEELKERLGEVEWQLLDKEGSKVNTPVALGKGTFSISLVN